MYAFITGASSGIGKEFSILLAKEGYNLILVARRKERLLELKKQLQTQYSIDVQIICSDLSKREHCLYVFEKVKHLPINFVINNAGFGLTGHSIDVPLEKELELIDTNITAVHIFTKLFVKKMSEGTIINVSSMASQNITPFFSAYGASKAYVYSFSQAVNYELKKQNKHITITTLCPGPVATEFYKDGESQSSLGLISAKTCAEIALKGAKKKKALVVPTVLMKITYFFSKIIPNNIMLPIQYFLQSSKKN